MPPPHAAPCASPRQWSRAVTRSFACFSTRTASTASALWYREVIAANAVVAQDEVDIAAQWRSWVQAQGLDGVVCIAAALRRGVLNPEEAQRYQRPAANLGSGWELSGLGQLHEATQLADRLVCFGGP